MIYIRFILDPIKTRAVLISFVGRSRRSDHWEPDVIYNLIFT